MTTGEGGVLVTDNEEWAQKARLLRSHGVTRNPEEFVGLKEAVSHSLAERGPWYYEMQELGYNYRLTDIQCALGRTQLSRLPEFMCRRREIAARYNEAFAGLQYVVPPDFSASSADFSFSLSDLSLHLYTIEMDFAALGRTRSQVMSALRDLGIGTQVLYIPVYLQPWYRRTFGYAPGKSPVAESFYSRALSLPLFPSMTDDNVNRVIEGLRKVLSGKSSAREQVSSI